MSKKSDDEKKVGRFTGGARIELPFGAVRWEMEVHGSCPHGRWSSEQRGFETREAAIDAASKALDKKEKAGYDVDMAREKLAEIKAGK